MANTPSRKNLTRKIQPMATCVRDALEARRATVIDPLVAIRAE